MSLLPALPPDRVRNRSPKRARQALLTAAVALAACSGPNGASEPPAAADPNAADRHAAEALDPAAAPASTDDGATGSDVTEPDLSDAADFEAFADQAFSNEATLDDALGVIVSHPGADRRVDGVIANVSEHERLAASNDYAAYLYLLVNDPDALSFAQEVAFRAVIDVFFLNGLPPEELGAPAVSALIVPVETTEGFDGPGSWSAADLAQRYDTLFANDAAKALGLTDQGAIYLLGSPAAFGATGPRADAPPPVFAYGLNGLAPEEMRCALRAVKHAMVHGFRYDEDWLPPLPGVAAATDREAHLRGIQHAMDWALMAPSTQAAPGQIAVKACRLPDGQPTTLDAVELNRTDSG